MNQRYVLKGDGDSTFSNSLGSGKMGRFGQHTKKLYALKVEEGMMISEGAVGGTIGGEDGDGERVVRKIRSKCKRD